MTVDHPALGLGDRSEADGAIPGTSVGSPGHPAGAHTSGRDIGWFLFHHHHMHVSLGPPGCKLSTA